MGAEVTAEVTNRDLRDANGPTRGGGGSEAGSGTIRNSAARFSASFRRARVSPLRSRRSSRAEVRLVGRPGPVGSAEAPVRH